MENRIRALREKIGISQVDLALAAGTTQQQIQRIETGAQSVKLDLALRICVALDSEITQVFPKTRSLLGRGKSKKSPLDVLALRDDDQAVEQFEGAGVDVDPVTWKVKFHLRGGQTSAFTISTGEKNRLRKVISEQDSARQETSFFVFHSNHVAVAVNMSHLLHYHELCDSDTESHWHDPKIPEEELCVMLADSREIMRFHVDSDPGIPDEPDDEGQLRAVLFTLGSYPHIDELFLNFRDVDGEDAFFRIPDIAMLTIPVWALDERLDMGCDPAF